MAQRDYVGRSRSGTRGKKNNRKKKSSSGAVSKLMIVLAVAVLVVFAGGLYFITQHKPETTTPDIPGQQVKPGNGLPPRPEERWSYIKELENRQVTNSPNSIGQPTNNGQVPLSEEQRKILEQIQSDMQQPATQLSGVDASGRPSTARDGGAKPALNNNANSATTNNTQPKKTTPPAPTSQTAAQAQNQRWIIQCGSFRDIAQAESVKVNLAFSGVESRISSSGGWNRVVLGPYNNRDSADKTLQRLKGSGVSNCIPVAAGK